MKNILTIAGSDSGGGAGIQADLKTITMLGAYGGSVITSITAQNTLGVQKAYALSEEMVAEQLDAVFCDIHFSAIKTGMLSNGQLINVISCKIKAYGGVNLVVDPVMVATSGDILLEKAAVKCLKDQLLPLAHLVTPNMDEAAVLSGIPVKTLDDMKKAAALIHQLGPQYVLVKGGHLSEKATDILYDGKNYVAFEAPKITTNNTHGTGCTLSAAIATFLGQGEKTEEAVKKGKHYLTEALKNSDCLHVGSGHGPLCHNFLLPEEEHD